MPEFLTVDDLALFGVNVDNADRVQSMIDDATALAVLAAPCIGDPEFPNAAAVRAILRGAILRWETSQGGVVSNQTAGPFGMTVDTRGERRGMFWPSEVVQLQSLCTSGGSYTTSLGGGGAVATLPPWADFVWNIAP